MSQAAPVIRLPDYKTPPWFKSSLPKEARDWTFGKDKSYGEENGDHALLLDELDRLARSKSWKWPKRTVFFFSDLHADPKAFVASLVASGGVRKTAPGLMSFRLTGTGRKATFIIGGDCFDKGPDNLKLLRAVRRLIDLGARVRILAGNHDVRTLLGMRAVGDAIDNKNGHFFLRLGPKVVPLLREIWDEYLSKGGVPSSVPGEKECRALLYPNKKWFDEFPLIAARRLPENQVALELKRIRKKLDNFEPACAEAGLSMRQVYAVVLKWRQLFLDPAGEFHWFFKRMKLGYHVGSFIFVHAGFDDPIARLIFKRGIKEVNRRFRRALYEDPFDLYYGSLANTIRTKYRAVDKRLSPEGADFIRKSGVHVIVHGHRNLHNGQRIMMRRGLINFECDATVDGHSRRKEGLSGPGAAVTVIRPEGHILGISTDFPYAKAFEPKRTLKALRKALSAVEETQP